MVRIVNCGVTGQRRTAEGSFNKLCMMSCVVFVVCVSGSDIDGVPRRLSCASSGYRVLARRVVDGVPPLFECHFAR